MKLFYTDRSPFARKVRVVAAHHGIALELTEVEIRPAPPELLALNPIGKVPALALEDGTLIADSAVIAEYLDGIGQGPKLQPADPLARARIRTIESVADGMLDAAVAVVYEHLMRAEEVRSAEVVAKHAKTIRRGATWLAEHREALEGDLHLGNIAVAVALDYLRHRMPEYGLAQAWEVEYFDLTRWLGDISSHRLFSETLPDAWRPKP